MNGKNRILSMLAVISAMAVASTASVHAQSCRMGIIGGANYNYVDVGMQNFVSLPNTPGFSLHDFSQASSIDGYIGVMGERMFNNLLGVTLRATVDVRRVEKEDNGATFTPDIVYLSVEPGMRINLGMPELHAMVGGTVAIKLHTEYDYSYNVTEGATDITAAEFPNVRDVALGAWAGIGYDIQLSDRNYGIGSYVTPFIEGSYLFDQKNPDAPLATDRWWNTLTVRGGLQITMEF